MATITISPGDPRDTQATALLQASHALMQSLFAEEENHFLSIDALCAPHIQFFVAQSAGQTVGCVALANMGDYGEIKSMFIDPDARGQGIADRLLETLFGAAAQLGLGSVKLETGDALAAAHKVYARHGFVTCGPFGDYAANTTSLFMTRDL